MALVRYAADTIKVSADEDKITFEIEKGETSSQLMEAVETADNELMTSSV